MIDHRVGPFDPSIGAVIGDNRTMIPINRIVHFQRATTTVLPVLQPLRWQPPAPPVGKMITRRVFSENHKRNLDTRRNDSYKVNFYDGANAYQNKTNYEVLRAIAIFKICSYEYFVANNLKLMSALKKVLGRVLFEAIMRHTLYGQLVAGETTEDLQPVLQSMNRSGMRVILDYSVEEDIGNCEQADSPNEDHYERNMETFLRTMDITERETNSTGFTALKLTALGPPNILMKQSELLQQVYSTWNKVLRNCGKQGKDSSNKLVSRDELLSYFKTMGCSGHAVRILESFSPHNGNMAIAKEDLLIDQTMWMDTLLLNKDIQVALNIGQLSTKGVTKPYLSHDDDRQLIATATRVNSIVERGSHKGVRIVVDAEQTYLQPAISQIVVEAMRKYNKERPVIYNTYQCYLKEAHNSISIDMDLARRENFCFGAKVVRGAYMDQERERAATVGYEDPINPTYEATTAMYERVISTMITEAADGKRSRVSVIVATQNNEAISSTVEKMKEASIYPDADIVSFGQHLGMCDHISYPLAQAGFIVYKYVPFGPLGAVLPYLSRRAQENRSVFAKVKRERELLCSELKRRLKKGQFRYKVPSPTPGS